MSLNGWLQISLFFLVTLALATPIGTYMTAVFERRRTWLDPILRPIERLLYKATGVKEDEEMKWTEYLSSVLIFSLVTLLLTYAVERLQHHLPLNPQGLPAVPANLAWSTAVSFTTNTNWQAYTPEATMSYLTQMLGLATHNFWSAAVGLALAVAFIRGIARKEMKTLGNFWVDLTRGDHVGARSHLRSLRTGARIAGRHPELPCLRHRQADGAAEGDGARCERQASDDRRHDADHRTGSPSHRRKRSRCSAPTVAAFTNANSAHPFENPSPFSNFLQMLSIFLIPAGLTVTLGQMTKSPKHGWAVFAAMAVLWLAGVSTAYWAEAQANPLFHNVNQTASDLQPGGNMEGKDVRFGIANSALFATVTTDASCGAINAQHDSFSPLGGMVPMVNILLGEIVFGGVGAGMYGMLIFVILSVFIAGLMVGRTPEYLGKKIESYDIQMAMLYLLIFPLIILGFSAVAILSPAYGLSSLTNHGPHGLSETPLRLHPVPPATTAAPSRA